MHMLKNTHTRKTVQACSCTHLMDITEALVENVIAGGKMKQVPLVF